MVYHLEAKDAREGVVGDIIKATFPEYGGRKFKIETKNKFTPDSSWSGGSRTVWKLVSRDGRVLDPEGVFGKGICNSRSAYESLEIPRGVMLVEHCIFCGKDMGITIVVRSDEMDNHLLPERVDLEINERKVLEVTSCYKSAYRREYAGLSDRSYNEALESLIEKGFLRKNKSITPAGRNVLQH